MGGKQGTVGVVNEDAHVVVAALFEMLGSGDEAKINLAAAELADNPDINAEFRDIFQDAHKVLGLASSMILQREREARDEKRSPRVVGPNASPGRVF